MDESNDCEDPKGRINYYILVTLHRTKGVLIPMYLSLNVVVKTGTTDTTF